MHERLGQGHLVQRVVLHRAAESGRLAWGDPPAVDVDVSTLEEDIDRAECVLLAEAEPPEPGDADLGSEQRQAGHLRVGAVRAAELVGSIGHRSHLPGLGPETRVDVLRRRSVEHIGSTDLEPIQRIDAAVEPAQSPGELAHRGQLATKILATPVGKEGLRAFLHHLAAVLDAPLRHRHLEAPQV